MAVWVRSEDEWTDTRMACTWVIDRWMGKRIDGEDGIKGQDGVMDGQMERWMDE